MMRNKITPEVAGLIARKLGIVSNSDRGWLEWALEVFAAGAELEEAVAVVIAEREERE